MIPEGGRALTCAPQDGFYEAGTYHCYLYLQGVYDWRRDKDGLSNWDASCANITGVYLELKTAGTISVNQNGKIYNVIQIGAGADSDSTGLLKSITADGAWEGTVYLVPFHTKQEATSIESLNTPVSGTQNQFTTGELATIKNADQAEITFAASKSGEARAWVEFAVYHKGCLVADSTTTYELTNTLTPYRYVLSNQLYESGLEIKVTFHTEAGNGSMEGITLQNLSGTLQTEAAGFTYYNGNQANRLSKPHEGGVTFDLLDRDLLG
jgi:hypothetical protein